MEKEPREDMMKKDIPQTLETDVVSAEIGSENHPADADESDKAEEPGDAVSTPLGKPLWRRVLRTSFWLAFSLGVALFLAVGSSGYFYLKTEEKVLSKRLDEVLSLRSESQGWRFHSRLFTDSFDLTEGRELDEGWLVGELLQRNYKETPCAERLETGAFCRFKADKTAHKPAGIRIRLRGWKQVFGEGPAGDVSVFMEKGILTSLEGLTATGDIVPGLEPQEFAYSAGIEGDLRRFVPLEEISPNLVRMVLASEDQRFYDHPGVDVVGIARAVWANLAGAGYRQGASTITQQVVRSFFLTREKRLARKIQEMAWALCLERLLPKKEILELYLNTIYWGQFGGHRVAGVEMASRFYFDVSASELSPNQAAALTAMIPAPQAYHPFRNPDALAKKTTLLLDMLSARGSLSERERELAATPVVFRQTPYVLPRGFERFAELVENQLSRELALGDPLTQGFVVRTSLDVFLLNEAQKALDKGLAEIEHFTYADRKDPLQGAAYMVDLASGLVPVVLAGRTRENDQYNRAFMMRRQPGSAFKPMVYIAALESKDEHGTARFTPTTLVPDKPRAFDSEEGPWRPRNNDYEYHESVTLAKALAKSINVATSNVVEAVGAATVADWAVKLGLPKPAKIVPSIGLGTTEASLPEMSRAYLPLLWEGRKGTSSAIRSVHGYKGEKLWGYVPSSETVMERRTALLMTQMLQAVVKGGTAFGLRGLFGFSRPALGKTGTTQREKDAWFVGATPQFLLTMWVGKDQGGPMYMPANDVAVPVWAKVANALLQKRPVRDFPIPEGYKQTYICPWTGRLANATCIGLSLALPVEEVPKGVCPESHPPVEKPESERERWWERRAREQREREMAIELERLVDVPL